MFPGRARETGPWGAALRGRAWFRRTGPLLSVLAYRRSAAVDVDSGAQPARSIGTGRADRAADGDRGTRSGRGAQRPRGARFGPGVPARWTGGTGAGGPGTGD